MPDYFDSHCHFDFTDFDEDRDQVWQQCQNMGIKQLLIPGTEPEQWQRAAKISEKYKGIFTAAGFHPWWVQHCDSIDAATRDTWHNSLKHDNCVAIGECGLDKMIDTDLSLQLGFFKEHLALACDTSLPLIIHVRKTHNETIKLLQQYQPKTGGIIHGFSGSIELAKQYWQLGFYLGIGGTMTYARANKTRETVTQLPLDAIVLETDAPDMPLSGFQGQGNTPLQIIKVAKTLAELRNEKIETITKTTTENAQQIFSI